MKADSHHLDHVIDWSSRWQVHAAAPFLWLSSSKLLLSIGFLQQKRKAWSVSEMMFMCGGW